MTEGEDRHRAVGGPADLDEHAAGPADRLHRLTTASDTWTSVRATHALRAATNDTAHTVKPLPTAARPLAEGTYLPVMLPAARCPTRTGRAARPAADLPRVVPTLDERLRFGGGRRTLRTHEAIRTAVDDLLAATC